MLDEFKNSGYYVITSIKELNSLPNYVTKLLGLFSFEHLPYYIDRTYLNSTEPTLYELTEFALKILNKNTNGFFVLIEAGKIDWANHNHDLGTAIWEIYELDKSVEVALKFLEKEPNTLIVITADHETGGCGLSNGEYRIFPELYKQQKISCETLSKLLKNKSEKDIKKIFAEYTGIKNLTDEEIEKIIIDGSPVVIGDIISKRAEIGWTTTTHSGQSVPVYAFGKGAELFTGVYDNTDIFKKFMMLFNFSK